MLHYNRQISSNKGQWQFYALVPKEVYFLRFSWQTSVIILFRIYYLPSNIVFFSSLSFSLDNYTQNKQTQRLCVAHSKVGPLRCALITPAESVSPEFWKYMWTVVRWKQFYELVFIGFGNGQECLWFVNRLQDWDKSGKICGINLFAMCIPYMFCTRIWPWCWLTADKNRLL
jgi:hypothetical protein